MILISLKTQTVPPTRKDTRLSVSFCCAIAIINWASWLSPSDSGCRGSYVWFLLVATPWYGVCIVLTGFKGFITIVRYLFITNKWNHICTSDIKIVQAYIISKWSPMNHKNFIKQPSSKFLEDIQRYIWLWKGLALPTERNIMLSSS